MKRLEKNMSLEDGGFERVVRHFTIDDLKEANVHILLTFDI